MQGTPAKLSANGKIEFLFRHYPQAIARTMGETAPILFTGVTYYTRQLPTSFSSKFMALPYHLFTLATQHDKLLEVRPIAFGTAIVLLVLVLLFDAAAFVFRLRFAGANKWQV